MTGPASPEPPVHLTAPNAFGGPAAKMHTACGAKMLPHQVWRTTTHPSAATCPVCLTAAKENE